MSRQYDVQRTNWLDHRGLFRGHACQVENRSWPRRTSFIHFRRLVKVFNEVQSVEVRVRSGLWEIPRLYGQSPRDRGQPWKIQALIDLRSPSKMKKVQSLTRRVATLSRFISKPQINAFPSLTHWKAVKGFCGMTSVNRHSGRSKST